MKFKIEWEQTDTDGVTHPALARTWARLEISEGDNCITRVRDKSAGGTRDGVYGPLFLVAEWVVRNFWFLLDESAPANRAGASWLRRHSLISAREGTSLPDLRLFRDEDKVIGTWQPSDAETERPVAFVESGTLSIDLAEARQRLSDIVDLVLDKVRGLSHPDVEALAADWNAITTATGPDLVLCRRAARMGLDAYDEREVPDELARVLIDGANRLPALVRDDLLDAGVSPTHLASAVGAIAEITRDQAGGARVRAGVPPRDNVAVSEMESRAYERGYAMARRLRDARQIPSVGRLDIDQLLTTLGWNTFLVEETALEVDRNLKGVVGLSSQGLPRLVTPPKSSRQRRFLEARGMYALFSGATATGPRALTGAGTSLQAASRAFAAELLAPAEAISSRIAKGLDEERVDDLADEFDVSSAVIGYQVENHRLRQAVA